MVTPRYSPPSEALQPPLMNQPEGAAVALRSPLIQHKQHIACSSDLSRSPHVCSPAGCSKLSPYSHLSPSISSLDLVNCQGYPLECNLFAASFGAAISKSSSFSGHCPSRHSDPHLYHASRHRAAAHTSRHYPPVVINLLARLHSPNFPSDHQLNPSFARMYELGDELGSGGFGFVMTARHREKGSEVAVKFIIKEKIPSYAYMEDDDMGRLPTEILLLTLLDHDNIIKCLDLYDDDLYYYMVQELHGTPWQKRTSPQPQPQPFLSPASSGMPELSPSTSVLSIDSAPSTPPPANIPLEVFRHASSPHIPNTFEAPRPHIHYASCSDMIPFSTLLSAPTPSRPNVARRPSHDLFECIETSEHKCLLEDQARRIFAQVVDAVHYLDNQGIAHRDIKDENILIDEHGKVKLIDFGSAAVVDPNQPRPFYDVFFGTTAYASSEILLKKPYQAAPAEVWTLGVLLSYLLTGASPFPTERDAVHGRIVLAEHPVAKISKSARNLLRRCLDPSPKKRAKIDEVRSHPWLTKL